MKTNYYFSIHSLKSSDHLLLTSLKFKKMYVYNKALFTWMRKIKGTILLLMLILLKELKNDCLVTRCQYYYVVQPSRQNNMQIYSPFFPCAYRKECICNVEGKIFTYSRWNMAS